MFTVYNISIFQAFKDEIDRRMKILEEQREHLILQPSWLCQWKVNIVGETVEGIEDCAKIINTISN